MDCASGEVTPDASNAISLVRIGPHRYGPPPEVGSVHVRTEKLFMFKRWLTAGSLFTAGLALAGQSGKETVPQIDFKKPAESVELFQQESKPEVKPEPAVLPDSSRPAHTVGSSAVESLDRI